MKYKIEIQKYTDDHTVDGITSPVTRTRQVAIPVLPRDWDALAARGVVVLILAVTAVSITWSTVSIAHLLSGDWTAYLAGGVFDLAWVTTLGMAYVVRFRPDRRKVVDRVGWALLAVTVTAIGLEGWRTGGLAVACIGASVSVAAKTLWWTFGRSTRPELSPADAQWVAAQISTASAQLAVASVRRQVARAQDRAAAELLAMQASRRPPTGTVWVNDTAPVGAPSLAPDSALDAAVHAALDAAPDVRESPQRTGSDLQEHDAASHPASQPVSESQKPARQPAKRAASQSTGRPKRTNRGVSVPPAARTARQTDEELFAKLDELGDAVAGQSLRRTATDLGIGETRAKRLVEAHAARSQPTTAPLSLVHGEEAS